MFQGCPYKVPQTGDFKQLEFVEAGSLKPRVSRAEFPLKGLRTTLPCLSQRLLAVPEAWRSLSLSPPLPASLQLCLCFKFPSS